MGTDSRPGSDLPEQLHRLRSTLARLRGELELAELDGAPPGPAAFGALEEALDRLGGIEAAVLGVPGRVLVLDDDERLAELLATRLRRRGFEVHFAGDTDALLREWRPGDRLVVDYGMIASLEDGALEAAGPALLGAVVVSGAVGDAAREHSLRLGAAAYLVKPVEMDALIALLRAVPEAGRW